MPFAICPIPLEFKFDFSVHLEAPDTVLLERYAGKRVDSLTGGKRQIPS